MFSNKDYSIMTLDELVSEGKKLNSWKMSTALFMGVLVGIAIWSATHKGSSLTFILLFSVILIGNSYTKKLKSIKAEINRRETVR